MKFSFIIFCLTCVIINVISRSSNACDFNATSTITSAKPFTGLVFWLGNSRLTSAYNDAYSLHFSYAVPSDVVLGKDGKDKINYDWSSLENTLNQIKKKGKQAIIRFRYEYPEKESGVPVYIRNLPDYNEVTKKSNDMGTVKFADWTHPELQWFTKQFIRDFAEKYDKDPRVAFIQVGFGLWSEYHISSFPIELGTNFPSLDFQHEYMTICDQVFSHTPYSISIDSGSGEYSPVDTNPDWYKHHFGLFDDSFMSDKHDKRNHNKPLDEPGNVGYQREMFLKLAKLVNDDSTVSRYVLSPQGGEISYYTSNDQKNFLNPKGMYGITWKEAAARYNITYMISNDLFDKEPSNPYATVSNVLQADLDSGYSLRISNVTVCPSDPKSVCLTVSNEGVAPVYHDMFVNVDGVKSTSSLRYLSPHSPLSISVPASLTPQSSITITSPKLYLDQLVPYNMKCVHRPNSDGDNEEDNDNDGDGDGDEGNTGNFSINSLYATIFVITIAFVL